MAAGLLSAGRAAADPVYSDDFNGVRKRWEVRFDTPAITEPRVSGKRVIVGNGDEISILDRQSGDKIDSVPLAGGQVQTRPVLQGNRYVVGASRTVNCVDIGGGSDWSTTLDRVVDSLLVEGNTVVVGLTQDYQAIRESASQGPFPGKVVGLDLADGKLQWERSLTWDIGGALVSDGAGRILVTEEGGVLTRINAQGETSWSRDLEGPFVSSPLVRKNRAYITNGDGQTYSVNIGSGHVTEIAEIGAASRGTTPVTHRSGIVASTDDGVYKLTESGDVDWYVETHSAANTPLVGSERLFVTTADGTVLAIQANSGTVQWTAKLGEVRYLSDGVCHEYQGLVGQPVRHGSTLYLSHSGGKTLAVTRDRGDD